jgi:hypothetical protein
MEADLVPPLMTKLTLAVRVAVWIREPGSGPPTHVRANSEPAASRAPPKALESPAGLGRARLVTAHTQTSMAHWDPSRAGFASQTSTCMGTFRFVSWKGEGIFLFMITFRSGLEHTQSHVHWVQAAGGPPVYIPRTGVAIFPSGETRTFFYKLRSKLFKTIFKHRRRLFRIEE